MQRLLQWKSGKCYIHVNECVFVALCIEHAIRMHHVCHLWSVLFHNTFSRYPINGAIFELKKSY
jgi:hypothetical protein